MVVNTVANTGVERTFDENKFIVSMTDTKGIVTYGNDIFFKIAEYREDEVLGQPHNILRHSDMPGCIFKFLWDTIESGEEVLAYVINKTKNGDHYWVFAHVTPSYNKDGKKIGYLSSRRVASKEALDIIKPLYKTLCEEEAKYSNKKEGIKASLGVLFEILKDKNVTYTDFIMSL